MVIIMALEAQEGSSCDKSMPPNIEHIVCSIIQHVYQPSPTALVTVRHAEEWVNYLLCTTKLNTYLLSSSLNLSLFLFSMLSYVCLTNSLSVELLAFCWLARLMWWKIKGGSPPFSRSLSCRSPFNKHYFYYPAV